MSEKTRDFLASLATGAVIGAAVFALNLSREYPVTRCACDGLFVAAVFLLGIGVIKLARNKGTFDVAGFGLHSVVAMVIPALRREEKEDLYQYRERKAQERRSSAGMLLAGAMYLALSLVALLVYELVQ